MQPSPEGGRSPIWPRLWVAARIPLIVLVLAGLLAASWLAYRLARADALYRAGTPDSVARAVQQDPGNARYRKRLAMLDPARAREALSKAAELNPYDAASRMELGLLEEAAGDFSAAEKHLLDAARVDKTYAPRWTLTNFYFRRNNREQFWVWARQAAEIAYHNQAALFDLCWRSSDNAEEIARRVLPDNPHIVAQYLDYLLGRGRLDAAGPVAVRLIVFGRSQDVPVLLNYCDRMIQTGRAADAVRSWNGLASRGLIPRHPVHPERGQPVSNVSFSPDFLPRGFGWIVKPVEGVSVAGDALPFPLRISLAGNQPGKCRLVEQYVAVTANRRYRFRFPYRTSGIARGSGLHWEIRAVSGGPPVAVSPGLSSEEPAAATLVLPETPRDTILRLALVYEQAPGTVRAAGNLWLGPVGAEFAQ